MSRRRRRKGEPFRLSDQAAREAKALEFNLRQGMALQGQLHRDAQRERMSEMGKAHGMRWIAPAVEDQARRHPDATARDLWHRLDGAVLNGKRLELRGKHLCDPEGGAITFDTFRGYVTRARRTSRKA